LSSVDSSSPQKDSVFDIVVVGGGMVKGAGSTGSPSFDSRSTALSQGSIQLFEQLGLWSSLSNAAAMIKTVAVSDKGHLGFTQFNTEDNDGQDLGAVVENRHLGKVLIKEAQDFENITFFSNTKVTEAKPKAKGMTLVLDKGGKTTKLDASLVVLADGALSQRAKQLGIKFTQHNYDQSAVIANVAHSKPHEGCAFECFSDLGPLAMLPLQNYEGKHRSALVWTQANAGLDELMSMTDRQFIDRLQKQFAYRLGQIESVGTRHSYPLNLYLAQEQVRSSLVLVGNAAHFLHPVAGQGFNLAMRDCAELCKQLKVGVSNKVGLGELDVLQKYAEARRHDQWLTTELSHQFIQLFASDKPIKQVLRNTGLLALNKMPAVKTLFFQQMMGTAGKGVSLP